MSKITVEMIREKYPYPVKHDQYITPHDETYCVGGAFCMYIGWDKPFPFVTSLTDGLVKHSKKGYMVCGKAASKIIQFNDSGNFDAAWEELRKILEVPNAQ